MCIRDIEPIRYSRYVDECCCILTEAAEFPTDTSVGHLTRIHGQAYNIAQTFTRDGYHMTPALASAPTGACVKALEADLLRLKSSFPEGAHHNGMQDRAVGALWLTCSAILFMHYYIVEIFLYERAIDERDQSPQYSAYPFTRLHMLHACLNSTRLCFDTFHAIPLSRLFDLPYTTWTSLGHAIVVLSKLSLLQTTDWDHEYVQNVLNFSECMDKLVQTLDNAKASAESTMERDGQNWLPQNVPQLFSMLPGTLQRVKAVHEAMHAAQISASGQGLELPSAESGEIFTDDEFLVSSATSFSYFFNEDFWQHFT